MKLNYSLMNILNVEYISGVKHHNINLEYLREHLMVKEEYAI